MVEALLQTNWYFVLAVALFAIGTYGLMTQRSAIKILISVELMLNAANINFAAFAAFWQGRSVGHYDGFVFALFSIAIAAAEAAVGLAIFVNLFRVVQGVDVDRATVLRW
ncbi:MAG TPA: NADH-quinone oxidoreductase subunit NuoK [Candidatus Thermoplasmatota archaeon]|nr:NADH-quinone oxidoreductase subunit NuoK [Candidatus Thermoplasmatota archaeon]